MNLDRLSNLIGAIIVIAGITVAVSHPETKRIISSIGNAGTNFLATAMGKGRR